MKVGELIDLLYYFDEDDEVGFSYDYGDHCHTRVISDIDSVDEEPYCYSEYFRMNAIMEGDEYDEESDVKRMVVIK